MTPPVPPAPAPTPPLPWVEQFERGELSPPDIAALVRIASQEPHDVESDTILILCNYIDYLQRKGSSPSAGLPHADTDRLDTLEEYCDGVRFVWHGDDERLVRLDWFVGDGGQHLSADMTDGKSWREAIDEFNRKSRSAPPLEGQ